MQTTQLDLFKTIRQQDGLEDFSIPRAVQDPTGRTPRHSLVASVRCPHPLPRRNKDHLAASHEPSIPVLENRSGTSAVEARRCCEGEVTLTNRRQARFATTVQNLTALRKGSCRSDDFLESKSCRIRLYPDG